MLYRVLLIVFVGLLIGTSLASAGNIYKVTSQDGEKTISYEVRFGGGRLMDQFTAFGNFSITRWFEPRMKVRRAWTGFRR